MLQPEPRSGEGCNTLSHEGFGKCKYMEKNIISSLLYTFISSTSSPKLFYSIVCKKSSPYHHEAYNEFTPDRRQSKTPILSTNVDHNYSKVFFIAISRLAGDNWQSKALVVAISDPRSSIVRQEFSIAAYPVWNHIFL